MAILTTFPPNYDELFRLITSKHLIHMTQEERESLKLLGDDWFFDGIPISPEVASETNKEMLMISPLAYECRVRTSGSIDDTKKPIIKQKDAQPVVDTEGEDTISVRQVEIHNKTLHINDMPRGFAHNFALEATHDMEQGIAKAIVEHFMINDRSIGRQSVGGYIPTGNSSGIQNSDCLRDMQEHFLVGYSGRSKWYMNETTGLALTKMKDGKGFPTIDLENTRLHQDGLPTHLLGKPIVYSDYMPDIAHKNIPIVLADLSRGYLIGRQASPPIVRRVRYGNIVTFSYGSEVLQPSAFKGLKISED